MPIPDEFESTAAGVAGQLQFPQQHTRKVCLNLTEREKKTDLDTFSHLNSKSLDIIIAPGTSAVCKPPIGTTCIMEICKIDLFKWLIFMSTTIVLGLVGDWRKLEMPVYKAFLWLTELAAAKDSTKALVMNWLAHEGIMWVGGPALPTIRKAAASSRKTAASSLHIRDCHQC